MKITDITSKLGTLVFGSRTDSPSSSKSTGLTEPDITPNYDCEYCKDGTDVSCTYQICPECYRQLDPFMNC